MSLFEQTAQMGHEQVIHCYDQETELKAIIAIHNTTLGPALGGCRMWPYKTYEDALLDVLRLSRGMTYKSAAAGLNLGGGKAVIIGDSKTMKSERLFRVFGRFVQSLGGRYITAEDVGTSVKDMEWMRLETDFVTGYSPASGGSGDPSPVTAFGVYQGMRACLKWHFGSDSFEDKTIVVQGVGGVGYNLLKHLAPIPKIKLFASDPDAANIKRAKEAYPNVEWVSLEGIYDIPCDVFAPCALGGIVNDETLVRLKCALVAGGANNVLADEDKHSRALMERGILYAPDFVINAGGLINVANEFSGAYNREQALERTRGIYDVLMQVFQIAKGEKITTQEAAKMLAERRMSQIGSIKNMYVNVDMSKRGRSVH